MPNRPMSKTTVPSTFKSASAELSPPALDLAQLERASQDAEHLALQRPCERPLLAAPHDQVVAGSRGEPIVLREADRSFGTGVDAIIAEEAAAQVEPETVRIAGHGIGGARLDARLASVGTFRFVEYGQAAEAIGKRRRLTGGIGDRPLALTNTLSNDRKHGLSFG